MFASIIPHFNATEFMLLVTTIMGFASAVVVPIKKKLELRFADGEERKKFEIGLNAVATILLYVVLQVALYSVNAQVAMSTGEFLGMIGLGTAASIGGRHYNDDRKAKKAAENKSDSSQSTQSDETTDAPASETETKKEGE